MNVLQRRMFTNGGPADQPLQAYSQLIASYAEKGLSVDEALVELGDPNFPRTEVEKIYAGLGYSIDPSITDYQIIPQNPAGIVLGEPDLDRSLDLTDVGTAPASLQLDFDTPEVSPIVEPVIENTTVPTGVGPNQIQLSDGRIIDVNIDSFKNNISGDNYQDIDIFGMLNNPNARLGTNVKAVLENELSGRKSSLGYDRFIGGIGDLGADFTLTKRIVGDVLTQGAEGLVDKGLAALDFIRTNPALRGILSRREAVEQQRKLDAGEIPPRVPFEFYQSPVIDEKGGPDFLSAVARGFATTDKLDDLYEDFESLEKSAQSKTILKTEDGTTLDLSPELPELPELEEITETDVQEEQLDQVEGQETKQDEQLPDEDVKKIPEVTYTFDANLAKEISETPSLFQTDAFRRFIRNVGTGLVKTGQIGSGLAAGSVLAAEEEKAIEDTKREALLEAIKEGDKGMDYKERKAVLDEESALATNIRDYNNAVAAQELAQSVIDFANGNSDLASFGNKIGATVSDIMSGFTGELDDPSKLSPTRRAQIALEILTNRNIKEILGESGRTISNIDRDIAKRVVGSLDNLKLDTVGSIQAKLQDNIRSIVEKRNDAQRNIRARVNFLFPYKGLGGFDQETLEIFQSELGQAIPVGTSTSTPNQNVIDLYPS